jgi:VWFA-related protein
MRRLGLLAVALGLTLSTMQAAHERPLDKGFRENVEVNLGIVDVQVLDLKGNAIPGLVAGDFELHVDVREVPIATFDVSCAERSERPAIVLAFDYQHLNEIQRGRALDSARHALEAERDAGGEIMVAAMTGGLRVEQSFTSERARIPAALRRMRDDATLYAGNFSHNSENGFVRGMTSLFDVAATLPQPKAILYYSAMRDVPLDSQFHQLAAMAAASRSVIFPVDVRGLDGDTESARSQAVVGGIAVDQRHSTKDLVEPPSRSG